ncbi:hypothetical protein COBT_004000, partial [Conglomerata obtusa]
ETSKAIESCYFRNDNHERNLHCDLRTDKLTLYTNRNKIEKDYESLDIEELYKNRDYKRLCESIIDKQCLSGDNRNHVNEIIKLRYNIDTNNDESIDYVMTDKQLIDIIYTKPMNRQDFIDSLGRMSNDEHNNIENAEKKYLENKIDESSMNEG